MILRERNIRNHYINNSYLDLRSIFTVSLPLISQKSSELMVDDETYTAQKTAVSNAGKLPIHQSHQVVTVLPPRTDEKVWVGTVTWASSKPIEVEMWHFYNSSITGVDADTWKACLNLIWE